jgi:hypothetical protein
MVIAGGNAEFPTWSCPAPNDSERPSGSDFVPVAVDALFGAR